MTSSSASSGQREEEICFAEFRAVSAFLFRKCVFPGNCALRISIGQNIVKGPPISAQIGQKQSLQVQRTFSRASRLEARLQWNTLTQLNPFRSTLKCTECGYESVTFEPTWLMSLPIPTLRSRMTSEGQGQQPRSRYSSANVQETGLHDCLDLFVKGEQTSRVNISLPVSFV